MSYLTIILFAIFAYLCGAIPFGVIIGKRFFNIDIREHGSKNTGSTNAFRTLGTKAGLLVFVLDMLKGFFPTFLANIFISTLIHPLLIGVCAILGHTFSIFLNLKGGKAVATSAGVLLAVQPLLFLIGFTFFAVTLYFFRMVSLSSILVSIFVVVVAFFLNDTVFLVFTICTTLFIIYRHKDNIQRIVDGSERKVPFGYNYTKPK